MKPPPMTDGSKKPMSIRIYGTEGAGGGGR